MTLQVYSTLTRKKEPFPKQPGEPVTMYVCGPTVYKPSHIGHMVGPVIFDTVKRYLTYLGYKVIWVVNITDVDDKLIQRAGELKTTVPALATKMTEDYFACLKKLNVTGIDHFPKATEHVPGMIDMIARLIEKGYAYPAGGDVYFDVSKDADYGKLCNRDPEQLEAGTRGETGDRKRNPGDFALWKGAKPTEPAEVQFESPWGKGRPGWHIECSAMSKALLGETLDIHGGGLDLQFPHHENELAQSESATGKPFARVWMHNGLLKLKNKDGKEDKMAGSLGNVLNVSRALELMTGDGLRFFILNTHYRSPIDLGVWDWANPNAPLPEGMVAAKRGYDTFVRFAERVKRVSGTAFAELGPGIGRDIRATQSLHYAAYHDRFCQHMDDDFNTGGAVGVLYELVTALNRVADRGKLEDPLAADPAVRADFLDGVGVVKEITDILGLTFEARQVSFLSPIVASANIKEAPDALQATATNGTVSSAIGVRLIQLLIELRNTLRALAKAIADKGDPTKKALFDQTDVIRKRLADLGVTLEDRSGGTTWRVG
ncbi:MAG TPA: cysteine--tRNA ligase [Fimbriiglobus sp.]|jgi:cysteinyl-tRNA synthetase